MTDYYQRLSIEIYNHSNLPTCVSNIILECCSYKAIDYKQWSEECYVDEKRKMFMTKLSSIPRKYDIPTTEVNSNYCTKKIIFAPEHSSSRTSKPPNWHQTMIFDSWTQTTNDGDKKKVYYYILFSYPAAQNRTLLGSDILSRTSLFGLLQIRHRTSSHDREPFLQMVVAETIELIYFYHEVSWWLTGTKIKITDPSGHGFFSSPYNGHGFFSSVYNNSMLTLIPLEKQHLLDKVYYLPKEKKESFIISLKDGTWIAKAYGSSSAQVYYCLVAAVIGSGGDKKPGLFIEYQLEQFMELYNNKFPH